MSHIAVLGVVEVWLTPFWLIAAGVALGTVIIALLVGLLYPFSKLAFNTTVTTIKEGILGPITIIALALTVFALCAAYKMPVRGMWNSVTRFAAVGPIEEEVVVEKETQDKAVPFSFRTSELARFEFSSDQDVFIAAKKDQAGTPESIGVEGGERPFLWEQDRDQKQPLKGVITTLYFTNESADDATVDVKIFTAVAYPEVQIILWTAGSMLALYLIYFLIQFILPKISAIALATSKEMIAQPLYLILSSLGAFLLVLYIYLPYFTFGEDVKMLKETGVTTIQIMAMIVALWTACFSISDEIEGRTALTLLSKPVSRRQFILGKFSGIVWPTVLMFIGLGLLFLITVSFKVVYDARESSAGDPIWQDCFREMAGIVPALTLAWMETVVMIAIGVAMSTRLPMLPNLIVCFSIYTIGHLTPLIVNSSAGKNEIVGFVGRLVSVALPMLELFKVEAAITGGVPVPMVYLGWSFVYCILLSTMALLLALLMFEDRDLA